MVVKIPQRRKVSSRGNVYAMLPYLFFFANLLRIMRGQTGIYLAVLTVVGIFGFMKLFMQHETKGRLLFCVVTVLMCAGTLMNALVTNNISIRDVFQGMLLLGVTVWLLLYPPSKKQAMLCFYVVALIFAYHWLIGTHPSHVLSSSCNYISVILLLFISLYYADIDVGSMNGFAFLPAVACFFLSVWGRGRSGILASGVLLIGLIFLKLTAVNKKTKRVLLAVVFLLVGAIAYLLIDDNAFNSLSWMLGSFQTEGFEDSARILLWYEYLAATFGSLRNFLFGTSLQDMPLIVQFNSNPHNSFIYLQIAYGLTGTVTFFVFFVRSIIFYIKQHKYTSLLVLLTLSLRAFTDKFVFLQYGMPVMMYLVLMPFVYRRKGTYKVLKHSR